MVYTLVYMNNYFFCWSTQCFAVLRPSERTPEVPQANINLEDSQKKKKKQNPPLCTQGVLSRDTRDQLFRGMPRNDCRGKVHGKRHGDPHDMSRDGLW